MMKSLSIIKPKTGFAGFKIRYFPILISRTNLHLMTSQDGRIQNLQSLNSISSIKKCENHLCTVRNEIVRISLLLTIQKKVAACFRSLQMLSNFKDFLWAFCDVIKCGLILPLEGKHWSVKLANVMFSFILKRLDDLEGFELWLISLHRHIFVAPFVVLRAHSFGPIPE